MASSTSASINLTAVQTSYISLRIFTTGNILHLEVIRPATISKTGTIILKAAANTYAARCGKETVNFAQGHKKIWGLVSSDVTFLLTNNIAY